MVVERLLEEISTGMNMEISHSVGIGGLKTGLLTVHI